MKIESPSLGALLFIAMVVGANVVMYGLVRGWTRPGSKNIFETLGQSFGSGRKKDDAMDELRRALEELDKSKKE